MEWPADGRFLLSRGLEVPITRRRIMAFKPSSVLKARINGQAAVGEEDDA
jgi:nucleoid DNA-binding protein